MVGASTPYTAGLIAWAAEAVAVFQERRRQSNLFDAATPAASDVLYFVTTFSGLRGAGHRTKRRHR